MGTIVRYIGGFDSVEVPEAGIVVERLKPVEIETELAKRMLLQEENWERPPKPKPRTEPEPSVPANVEKEGGN